MIRYIYGVGFLLCGMGIPLFAKTVAPKVPASSYSSKTGIKLAVLQPVASTKSEVKSDKKTVATVAPATHVAAGQPLGSPILGNRLVAFPSGGSGSTPASPSYSSATQQNEPGRTTSGGRLARVTAYWAGEGDYYTGRCLSATGVRLHDGHCAVDPNIIPYGSIVEIAGVGKYLAVDTGSAVVSRTAAREGGHNSAERNALVVDVFFEDAREGEKFAAGSAKFVSISWWTPRSADSEARARGLFADEDWAKIQGKQL